MKPLQKGSGGGKMFRSPSEPVGVDLPASVDLDLIGIWYNPLAIFSSPVRSARNGNWSNPMTWQGGVVPSSGSTVQIHHDVTVDSTGTCTHCVVEDIGTLRFADGFTFSCGTLSIAGRVVMGTQPSRIGGTYTIRNIAKDATNDPDDVWVGIINFTRSKWTSWGTSQTVTHVRMEDADATDTTITLTSTPTGWRIGDRLYIPGMRRTDVATVIIAGEMHQEYRTIANIVGNVITLDSALTYDHHGQSSPDALYTFQPVIQNLSRSIVIKSESATGNRGYWYNFQRADVGAWYTEFANMSRTVFVNDVDVMTATLGRHCCTFYDYNGPEGGSTQVAGKSASIHGNSFWADPTTDQYWGPTFFSSHFVHFHRNDINGFYGTGPCFFEGPESYNEVRENRSMNIKGTGSRETFSYTDTNLRGQAGDGFFFRGVNNYVLDNVAANCYGIGNFYTYGYIIHQEFLYINEVDTSLIPSSPAAVGEEPATPVRLWDLPVLQWENNEAFSCQNGMTWWWVNLDMFHNIDTASSTPSVFQSQTHWNTYGWGIFAYDNYLLVWDDYTYLCSLTSDYGRPAAIGTDYRTLGNYTIRNSHCYGVVEAQINLFRQSDFRYGNGNGKGIASITNQGGFAKLAFDGAHGLSNGETIEVFNNSVTAYNTFHAITSVPDSTHVVTDQAYTSNGGTAQWCVCFGNDYDIQTIQDTLVTEIVAQPMNTTGLFQWQVELIMGRMLILNNVTYTGTPKIWVGGFYPDAPEILINSQTVPNFVKVLSHNGNSSDNFYIQTTQTLRDVATMSPEMDLFGAAQAPRTGIEGDIYDIGA